MPYKDPAKRRAHDREYQRPWMRDKIKERREAGICRVSGCGAAAGNSAYCQKHKVMNTRTQHRAYVKSRAWHNWTQECKKEFMLLDNPTYIRPYLKEL